MSFHQQKRLKNAYTPKHACTRLLKRLKKYKHERNQTKVFSTSGISCFVSFSVGANGRGEVLLRPRKRHALGLFSSDKYKIDCQPWFMHSPKVEASFYIVCLLRKRT